MTVQAASQYYAEYRCYAGPLYSTLYAAGITTSLSGWTAPTTSTPSGWTDISARVNWDGQFTLNLQSSSITWQAQLNGENYDVDYLGIGRAIVLWRRYWDVVDGWAAWAIEFIGQVINTDDTNTYKNGKIWQRTIGGSDTYLARINTPPLSIGPINIMDGATVNVKDNDVLLVPELEINSGEFIGAIANVNPDNIVDGKLSTVFISDSTPGAADPPTDPVPQEDGTIIPSEVFFAPIAGWSPATNWWVEVFNWRNTDADGVSLRAADWIGPDADDYNTERAIYIPLKLPSRSFGIVAANRLRFESYTGGAPAAAWVADAGEFNADFTISACDGYVATSQDRTADIMIWAASSASRKALAWHTPAPGYAAAGTFNSNSASAYSNVSMRNQLATYVGNAGPSASSWFSANPYPSPGSHTTNRGGVAIQVELTENTHRALQSVAASGTSVALDSYIGFPYSGSAICEGDTFTYTSITSSGLTGASNIDSAHEAGALVYPYARNDRTGDYELQTGYPVNALTIRRRKPPYIQNWQMYWSPYAGVRHYQDDGAGWREDYHNLAYTPSGGNQAIQEARLWNAATSAAYLWVRTILLVIDRMTDGGRAKLNEITATLGMLGESDTDVTITPTTDTIDEILGEGYSRSANLAHYLLTAYAGLATTDFSDTSDTQAHDVGTQKIGITSFPNVLDDIARQTGCLVYYAPDGKIYWLDDPWWPLRTTVTNAFNLTNNDLVNEITVNDDIDTIDYVILDATSIQGDTPSALRVVYPPPHGGTEPPVSTLVEEINGYTVSSDALAKLVAERIYRKMTQPGTCSVTTRGIFAIRPGQVVSITADYGRGASETWQWQITNVEYIRDGNNREQRLLQKARLRLWAKSEAPA